MRLTGLAVLVPGLWIAAPAAMADTPKFKEGEWGTRYTMEVVGAPFPMPPITVKKTACLTSKNFVPDNSQPGQNCQISDTRVSGNTVSWKMTCKTAQGQIEGNARIKFADARYDGTMDSRLVNTDGVPSLTYRYGMEGQWLGPCGK